MFLMNGLKIRNGEYKNTRKITEVEFCNLSHSDKKCK